MRDHVKVYALPGSRTYHELVEPPIGPHMMDYWRRPHLKCDPRKKYNDLMIMRPLGDFDPSKKQNHEVRTNKIFLCGRCARMKR